MSRANTSAKHQQAPNGHFEPCAIRAAITEYRVARSIRRLDAVDVSFKLSLATTIFGPYSARITWIVVVYDAVNEEICGVWNRILGEFASSSASDAP